MNQVTRRAFVRATGALAGSLLIGRAGFARDDARRRFRMNLNVGQVGVKADPFEAIALAEKYGYESVTPLTDAMLRYSDAHLQRLKEKMNDAALDWGAGVVRPFFAGEKSRFNEELREIGKTAQIWQRVGITRCMTWAMPSSDTLTYRTNFRLHVERTRQVCQVLGDHGVRLGLEYLGTKTLVLRWKYPFVQTLVEARELTDEVGANNVGLVLDSWHWYQAADSEQDILRLRNEDVVSADICDAPAGIPREQMTDSPRKLPCTTGVIDVAAFLRGLVKIGYDGPVGTEPFDKSLQAMSTEQAMTTATDAMKKAFALVE